MFQKKKKALRAFEVTLLIAAWAMPLAATAELKIKHFALNRGRLAFTYMDGAVHDIYVLDFAKLTIEPLYASKAIDEYPSFSPDGKKVAFYSDASGDREIYVIDSNGTNLVQLTNSAGADEDPDWSPNGEQIIFQSARLGKDTANLFVMNADGTKPEAITRLKEKKNTVPRWSPRGNEILYSTTLYWPGWDIMLYDVATKKSKLLTNGWQSFCRASWRHDGSMFAFSYGSGKNVNLWIQDKGEKPYELTTLPGREYDAVWSDDGKRLFFVAESREDAGDFQIYMLELATKNITQITEGDGAIRYLSWTSLPVPPVAPVTPKEPTTPNEQQPRDAQGEPTKS